MRNSGLRSRAAYLVLIALSVPLASCDSSQVTACEDQLKAKLKSPASYKRIKFRFTQIDSSIHKPPYDQVTITYDAANSFNALLRDEETCFYRPRTTNEFDPYANEAIDMNALENLDTTATTDANVMPEGGPSATDNVSTEESTGGADAVPADDTPTGDYDANNDAGE